MEYVLMHKDIPVLEFDLNSSGFVVKVNDVYNQKHIPVGVLPDRQGFLRKSFSDWWTGRSIPASRENLKEALLHFGLGNQLELLPKSYGLSLSDCYWVKSTKGKDASLRWDDINFYKNTFTDDVGEFLLAARENNNIAYDVNFMSPSPTTSGQLKKKWSIRKDGVRVFLKGGRKPFQQEPFNEALASRIFSLLGIPHAEYTLCTHKKEFYSVCPCIASESLELVYAWDVFGNAKKTNNMSYFDQLFKACGNLGMTGISSIRQDIGKIFVVDYLIANTDRHLNNLAFFRNPDTLEWKGVAPVYDNGTSMFCDSSLFDLKEGYNLCSENIEAKPFAYKQSKMLKKTMDNCDVSGLDFSRLEGIQDWFLDLLSHNPHIELERSKQLALILENRVIETDRIVSRPWGMNDGSGMSY